MNIDSIKNDEKTIFVLRALYDSFGYSRYKMSKFEEYELYMRNKDFLISDSIISFTDTNGRLMALKPDVTLSIVKNTKDVPGQVQKLYYNENIYRVSKGSQGFREMMQVGLECIGEIDDYCIFEVLTLAAASLKAISPSAVLNISHLGLLAEAICGVSRETEREIYRCISEKNLHELRMVCNNAELESERTEKLEKLATCFGTPEDVLTELEKLFPECAEVAQLQAIVNAFRGSGYEDMLRIDFSVMSDINYYNGFAFKGFVDGVPAGVLSGGQYDRLMRKMNRKSRAIGFAVYLDMLERLQQDGEYDVDIVLIYDSGCDMKSLRAAADALSADGSSVRVLRNLPGQLRCRKLAKFSNGEVKILEEYA